MAKFLTDVQPVYAQPRERVVKSNTEIPFDTLWLTNSECFVSSVMLQSDDRTVLLVTEAVSDALEVPIEELPPLSESISLDGLDAIVSSGNDTDVAVTFSYAGLRVFVHSREFVYVRPTYENGSPERDRAFPSDE